MKTIAPGGPGSSPTWTSSAKDSVGTSLGRGRVWFTVGRGILNEVYWPSCSMPQIRDVGFIVKGEDFWSEVKRLHNYTISTPSAELPLPTIVHEHPRYRLTLEILADSTRDVLLIQYNLESLDGSELKLYPLLAPHLGLDGDDNHGLVTDDGLLAFKGSQYALLAADCGFSRGSVGYIGASDGWQDFSNHSQMCWTYDEAGPGNIALIGELNANRSVLALSFSYNREGAATLAKSALASGFASIRKHYIQRWTTWQKNVKFPMIETLPPVLADSVRKSITVIKAHEGRTFAGAFVASLSIPWGDTHKDIGGYHLVWPRDLVQVGFALLACGLVKESKEMLAYLISIQQSDGHWRQNNFVDGRPYWQGLQLDEVALPVLFATKLHELNLLGDMVDAAMKMTKKAVMFIAQNGPVSPQDRWEENSGINPFSLATVISALSGSALNGLLSPEDAKLALSLADNWNDRLESWVYVENSELDLQYKLKGHYVRINPNCQRMKTCDITLRNRTNKTVKMDQLLGLEYLYLSRLGLRHANDPRMKETTQLIDQEICKQLPAGPYYYRYNGDGYGEHASGHAFDGLGIGRLWPLLSGERGHYAVATGEDPTPYINAMLASASDGGMLPEQIWDQEDIPERHLFLGRPTGSAMPLIWAHAELIKLIYVQKTEVPIEQLTSVATRYSQQKTASKTFHWRDDLPDNTLRRDQALLIESTQPFVLHYGVDGWTQIKEKNSIPLGLGLYGVLLTPKELNCKTVQFTRYFNAKGWEGIDWEVIVQSSTDTEKRASTEKVTATVHDVKSTSTAKPATAHEATSKESHHTK